MNQINKKSITDRENNLLPFLKLQIKEDPLISMDFTIRKSKNIINDETFRLVDEFKILKFKNNIRNSILNPNKTYKSCLENKKISRISINNNNTASENNLFLKGKFKGMKTSNNKTDKYKKIKNIKLSSGKDKYLSLLKKYQYNYIKRKGKLLDESKINNYNNSLLIKTNKSNSNYLINETQINNVQPISKSLSNNKMKITKQDFNKSYSKFFTLEKELYDTQKNSMNIIKRIKRYKIISQRESKDLNDKLQKNEESIKRIEDIIDEENTKKNRITKINYGKILGPLEKNSDINLKKIKISKKSTGQIWLRQSTVNMLKFGQYFNKMDDEKFFKDRKKIINKFAAIEKDSNIIDGIKTERVKYNNYGKGIKKNNKIIKQLAEDNFDFFQNITKKLENID